MSKEKQKVKAGVDACKKNVNKRWVQWMANKFAPEGQRFFKIA